MNSQTQFFLMDGMAGKLECALDIPAGAPVGMALIAHPHPLYGGTLDNKVVQMLARSFTGLGYLAVRMNFRGVGRSGGTHDEGRGETEDMYLLLQAMQKQYPGLPLVLSGFSFGTYVQAQLANKLIAEGTPIQKLVLVSVTAGRWAVDHVPANTLLIHGEYDDVIPLKDVFEWARPQDLPVTVVTGGDHLFNRKLHHLRHIVRAAWGEGSAE